jgi:hypothetical protein
MVVSDGAAHPIAKHHINTTSRRTAVLIVILQKNGPGSPAQVRHSARQAIP